MKIIIKETNATETLSIIDSRTSTDYTVDFIGNNGALSDNQFKLDEETGFYHCDQDTFDWWEKVLADHQEVDDRIKSLSDQFGSDKVQNIISKANVFADLEDQPAFINNALDEAFTPGK